MHSVHSRHKIDFGTFKSSSPLRHWFAIHFFGRRVHSYMASQPSSGLLSPDFRSTQYLTLIGHSSSLFFFFVFLIISTIRTVRARPTIASIHSPRLHSDHFSTRILSFSYHFTNYPYASSCVSFQRFELVSNWPQSLVRAPSSPPLTTTGHLPARFVWCIHSSHVISDDFLN